MAKPEQIQSDSLRSIMVEAHQAMRAGEALTVVQRCAQAFLRLAEARPEVLQLPPGMRVHPFPRLGAMLVLDEGAPPRVDFQRENFSLSEAIMYYEYVLTAVLAAEQRADAPAPSAT